MITDGPYFTRTLDALALRDTQREDTIRNATNIVSAVMASYGVPPAADVGSAAVPIGVFGFTHIRYKDEWDR